MPATYTLIASNTLSSSAASVTFSAIPGTYTDLIIKASIRGTSAGTSNNLFVRLNNDSTSIYSCTSVATDGASAFSGRESNQTRFFEAYANGNGSTSNTFSFYELYIPSYLASQNKPVSWGFAAENNATQPAELGVAAGLFRSTSAVSQIEFYTAGGTAQFVSGSSFFLYGIKNS